VEGTVGTVATPGHRDYLGHLTTTIEDSNRLELVLGTKSRSGGQWDIWEAVYSPVGADGYPQRIWDKRTGVIDRKVAGVLEGDYDLVDIMRATGRRVSARSSPARSTSTSARLDNYYLNNAVYLATTS
jgi:hypothetical protein